MLDCCFCKEFGGPEKQSDRLLWENGHWVATPSLGAFTLGYLLLICQEHYPSLATTPRAYDGEWLALLHRAKKMLRYKLGKDCVLFEHGSASFTGANSIDHVHLHIVPCESLLWEEIEQRYQLEGAQRLSTEDELLAYLKEQDLDNYLLFGDTSGRFFVYRDTLQKPSQFFRRVMAEMLGTPKQWDWRSNPLHDQVARTLVCFSDEGL